MAATFQASGHGQQRRTRSCSAVVLVLFICSVRIGPSFAPSLPRIKSTALAPSGISDTFKCSGFRLVAARPRPSEETPVVTMVNRGPASQKLYLHNLVVAEMLETLQLFPVQGDNVESNVTSYLASVPTVEHTKVAPAQGMLRDRWARITLGVLAVAVATMALRLGTAHLDALAHSASKLLAAPSMLVAAVAGAAAGSLHTLSGPDHLAALTPLALKVRGGPGAAFRTGAFWGSGHVLGQLLLGLGLLALGHCKLFSRVTGLLRVGAIAERAAVMAVGLVLLLIGAMGLKEAQEWQDDAEDGAEEDTFCWKTFGTGVLSGMHPDALLLCLPALALPTRLAGFSFLAAFGAGTLVAMGGYTAALHCACSRLGQPVVRRVSMIASGVAVAVGATVCCTALGVPILGGLM